MVRRNYYHFYSEYVN